MRCGWWEEKDDKRRQNEKARDGSQISFSQQCEYCHFYLINQRTWYFEYGSNGVFPDEYDANASEKKANTKLKQ